MSSRIAFFVLLVTMVACQQQEKYTIHMIGDSTMADKKNPEVNPERGWGQVLPDLFSDQVEIYNHAVNGRSTKSFIDEGKWEVVLGLLKEGDYVFIQFGHNDQKIKDPKRYTNPYTTYRANLIRYIEESRNKGAIPVLFSSIVRRKFNENGVLVDTHGIYPEVMRQVALAMDVPFIDMQLMSEQTVMAEGVEKSKDLYLWLEPGESELHPEGKQDNTHFCVGGANIMSGLAVSGMKKHDFPFLNCLKNADK